MPLLDYDQYRCRACDKQFNQRTSSKLNFIEFGVLGIFPPTRTKTAVTLDIRGLPEGYTFLKREIPIN